jgi:hypothetical protein
VSHPFFTLAFLHFSPSPSPRTYGEGNSIFAGVAKDGTGPNGPLAGDGDARYPVARLLPVGATDNSASQTAGGSCRAGHPG